MQIVLHNLLDKPIYIYEYLHEGDLQDRFYNMFFEMQEFDLSNNYQNYILRFYQNALDGPRDFYDSLRHYDLPKKKLGPFLCDTLMLRMWDVTRGLGKGKYRFKVHLRVNTIQNTTPYSIKDDPLFTNPPDNDKIEYQESQWFYIYVQDEYITAPEYRNRISRSLSD